MITANDVFQLIKLSPEIVDKFIKDELVPRFRNSGGKPITVPVDYFTVREVNDKTALVTALLERGFSVKYECEDRPCGRCYYKISIPPQVLTRG